MELVLCRDTHTMQSTSCSVVHSILAAAQMAVARIAQKLTPAEQHKYSINMHDTGNGSGQIPSENRYEANVSVAIVPWLTVTDFVSCFGETPERKA